jgi:hypothetical protein
MIIMVILTTSQFFSRIAGHTFHASSGDKAIRNQSKKPRCSSEKASNWEAIK